MYIFICLLYCHIYIYLSLSTTIGIRARYIHIYIVYIYLYVYTYSLQYILYIHYIYIIYTLYIHYIYIIYTHIYTHIYIYILYIMCKLYIYMSISIFGLGVVLWSEHSMRKLGGSHRFPRPDMLYINMIVSSSAVPHHELHQSTRELPVPTAISGAMDVRWHPAAKAPGGKLDQWNAENSFAKVGPCPLVSSNNRDFQAFHWAVRHLLEIFEAKNGLTGFEVYWVWLKDPNTGSILSQHC